MKGGRSHVLVHFKVVPLCLLHQRKTATREIGFFVRAGEGCKNPGVGVTSGGTFSGFVVAAPKQKFAGGKEGPVKELCTRSTGGREAPQRGKV